MPLDATEAESVQWAWAGEGVETLSLKWGRDFVPAAAVAYAGDALFLALPGDGPTSRGRPAAAACLVHETSIDVWLQDSNGELLQSPKALRLVEFNAGVLAFPPRRPRTAAPFEQDGV